MNWRRRNPSPAARLVFLTFSLLAAPIASGADEVLTVSDVIRNRAELDGKIVAVRGMFALEGAVNILVPDHVTEFVDDHSHSIDLQTDGFPLYKFYGYLERARIIIKGRVRYIRECDYRIADEARSYRIPSKERSDHIQTEDSDIITICHITSEIQLHTISELKIIDTYTMNDPRLLAHARKDPRVSAEDVAPARLEPLPQSDPEYARVAALARDWRQAILDCDFRALAKLSLGKEASHDRKVRKRVAELSDRRDRFYNVVFRGRDRLQAQLRRNRSRHTFIGFMRSPKDQPSADNMLPYEDLNICYCLREVCTEKDADTLKYFSYGSNLKDPFWCFAPIYEEEHGWSVHVYHYYNPD